MNDNLMTVTVKLNSNEVQNLCELLNDIKKSNNKNLDSYELGLDNKLLVYNVVYKLISAASRKVNKLEELSLEFRSSIDFGNMSK